MRRCHLSACDNSAGLILVVDDDEDYRMFVSLLLQRVGYETCEAATGEEALDAARRTRPDLVLLDVHMPGLSGYEICRELRDEFGQQLPIIFVSGARTEAYDRAGGLLLGADDYVIKPFAPDELLARVRRLVGRSRQDSTLTFDLTKRELQVLRLLASGRGQAELAAELFITSKTVATHIQHVLAKLGVHSRAEAVAVAHRQGLDGNRAGSGRRVPVEPGATSARCARPGGRVPAGVARADRRPVLDATGDST